MADKINHATKGQELAWSTSVIESINNLLSTCKVLSERIDILGKRIENRGREQTMTPEELESELRRLLKDVEPFEPKWSPERKAAAERLHLMIDEIYHNPQLKKKLPYDLLEQYQRIISHLKR